MTHLYGVNGSILKKDGNIEILSGCLIADSEDAARGHHLKWMMDQKPGRPVLTCCAYLIYDHLVLEAAEEIRKQEGGMKLWLLTAPSLEGQVDVFTKVVVAAESRQAAREVHPLSTDPGRVGPGGWVTSDQWVEHVDQVEVVELGDAARGVKKGVVVAEFSPGDL